MKITEAYDAIVENPGLKVKYDIVDELMYHPPFMHLAVDSAMSFKSEDLLIATARVQALFNVGILVGIKYAEEKAKENKD